MLKQGTVKSRGDLSKERRRGGGKPTGNYEKCKRKKGLVNFAAVLGIFSAVFMHHGVGVLIWCI